MTLQSNSAFQFQSLIKEAKKEKNNNNIYKFSSYFMNLFLFSKKDKIKQSDIQ